MTVLSSLLNSTLVHIATIGYTLLWRSMWCMLHHQHAHCPLQSLITFTCMVNIKGLYIDHQRIF